MIIIHGITGGVGGELWRSALSFASQPVFATAREDMDISSLESIKKFYTNVSGWCSTPGAPLHVINATGVCRIGKLGDVTPSDWELQRSVNIDGNFHLAQAWMDAIIDRPGSTLTLLSSVVHRRRLAGTAAYAMGKGAMHALVQVAATEAARYKGRVNAVEMGYFDTGMISIVPERLRESLLKEIPARRFGKVDELWTLLSTILNNTYLSGATLQLTGGL